MAAQNFTYRIAETREDIEGAVRLVYRNYVELKYCNLNRFGVHFYLYDVLPETRTLVALDGDRVIATLTLVFDSPLGLPSGKLYGAEIEALRRDGRRMVEVSKLSVDRELGARGLAVLKGLFRLAWLVSAPVRGCTDFIIMVEPHHERFYARSLLFERAGELKPDPEAADAPSILLRLRLSEGPERYRAAFGEEAREANPYWYFCLSPEVPTIEAEARAVDERLLDMNRRLETGRKMPNPTFSERRYFDYRLFSIAFVTDKTCKEAEKRAQHGLFRDEIEAYDRLLAVLPPDYAPERRARIFLDIAYAAFYCAMYERTLTLARAIETLAVGADLLGQGRQMAAMALHFLGRRNEAREEIQQGLALRGLPGLVHARLLRTDGRMAVDRMDLAAARKSMEQAREELCRIPDSPEVRKLRATLAHDVHTVEMRSGNMNRARAVIEEAAPFFVDSPVLRLQYHEAMSDLDTTAGRPRSAAEHARQSLAFLDANSSHFNMTVMSSKVSDALLETGDVAAARAEADRAMEFSRNARHAGVRATALRAAVLAMVADDDLPGAEAAHAQCRSELGTGMTTRAGATLDQTGALLAVAAGRLDEARDLAARAEDAVKTEPYYRASLRCLRVHIELLASSGRMAARLLEDLLKPEELPGNLVYEVDWLILQALVDTISGRSERSLDEIARSLDFYRSGGALLSMANAALQCVESLRACRVAGEHSDIVDLCLRTADEACSAARLPNCARRLADIRKSMS